jgi:hypothetical protein
MKYTYIADWLWYTGHILSGFSIIFTRTNYDLAVSCVIVGQFITIISRPIGRLSEKKNSTPKMYPEINYTIDKNVRNNITGSESV